jgi:hypothetical protein
MTLLEHVLRFGRALHARGIPVSTGAMVDLCHGLRCIDLGQRADVHTAMRALLVTRREHLQPFDEAFAAFWDGLAAPDRPPGRAGDDGGAPDPGGDHPRPHAPAPDRSADPGDDRDATEASPELSEASCLEVLRRKDFATLSRDEVEQARRAIACIARRFASRAGRRYRRATEGPRLDFRRMYRRSLPRGLLPWAPERLRRREQEPRLVLLCDVSGSMERYSLFLIQFICGLRTALRRVDIGMFATRLGMITRELDRLDVMRSVERLARTNTGWGGGTDIGASLRGFRLGPPPRALHRRTVVVILSDGWNCGDDDLLREEMGHLRRAARRLIWLNPLLGRDGYEPLCRGIRTALPYLDHFLPAHNLASLERVGRILAAPVH